MSDTEDTPDKLIFEMAQYALSLEQPERPTRQQMLMFLVARKVIELYTAPETSQREQ